MAYPASLERLVSALARFPGIGRRTAERLAFHALRAPEDGRELVESLGAALTGTLRCQRCFNVAEQDPCGVCAQPERGQRGLLVVEEPKDVEAVERSGAWSGGYHVLLGALNPAEGTEAEHLSVAALVRRVEEESPAEVVLGTDPDAEGEATALVVLQALERAGAQVPVTRLARGLPAGVGIEYLHRGVLEDALEGRVSVRRRSPAAGRGSDSSTSGT